MRHDVAPEIRRGWIAVLENDCIAGVGLDVGHPSILDGHKRLVPVRLCRDRHEVLRYCELPRHAPGGQRPVNMSGCAGFSTLTTTFELVH